MNKSYILGILTAIFLTACASTNDRGTVAMKLKDGTAHVCLGNNDVKVGDSVMFYNNVCTGIITGGREGSYNRTCDLEEVGKGNVTRLLNKHYSVISTDQSFDITEGMLVQKM